MMPLLHAQTVAVPHLGWKVFTWAGYLVEDGKGRDGRFSSPQAITARADGSLLVANGGYTRSVRLDGAVTTVTGDNAVMTAYALATDPVSGVVYQFSYNQLVTPSDYGSAIVIAGSGAQGSTDGTGSAAAFKSPQGIAVGYDGCIYVADSGNHSIRKVTPLGVVTTLAGKSGTAGYGDGIGNAARFNYPTGVAVDRLGNVYVADAGNRMIRKVSPSGLVTSVAGNNSSSGYADGTGRGALFRDPYSIAIAATGELYVTDRGAHTIRRVTTGGRVTTIAGLHDSAENHDGSGAGARFSYPYGITVGRDDVLYVADAGNLSVRRVTKSGVVTTLAGNATTLVGAQDVAVDSKDDVYIADAGAHVIRRLAADGGVKIIAGQAGLPGSGNGFALGSQFNAPQGLVVDGAGNLYVADTGNHTIRKVTASGLTSTLAGTPGTSGSNDGAGAAARFNSPTRLALDVAGNIYVTDTDNHTIRKITPQGVVSTLAGAAGQAGAADDTGTSARFSSPRGLVVDAAGNVFVADRDNSTIRKITSGGVVTTFAGAAGTSGSDDGLGAAARFSSPISITLNPAGGFIVPDQGGYSLRYITAAGAVTTGNAVPAAGYGLAVSRAGEVYWASSDAIHRGIAPKPDLILSQADGRVLRDGVGVVSFGSVPTGYSVAVSLTIQNTGTEQLNSLAIEPDAGASADFVIGDLAVTTLEPGERTTFTVTFSPSTTGPQTTLLHLASNAPDYGTYDITLKGSGGAAPAFSLAPASAMLSVGDAAVLSSAAVGPGPMTFQWRKNGSLITGATGAEIYLGSARLSDAGGYTNQARNTAGAAVSAVAQIAVVDPTLSALASAAGSTLVLTAKAAGNGLTYQWLRDGAPLNVDGRMQGWNTKTLTVEGVQPADSASYSCEVTGPGGVALAGGAALTVFDQAPVILQPLVMPAGIVASRYQFQIPVDPAANRLPTSYGATGLPAGLSINANTGIISGRPTTAKATPTAITLTAMNAKGKSTAKAMLVVSPLPAGVAGSFTGMVARHSGISGGGLGGVIDLTTTATGAFTGTLKLGSVSYGLAGIWDVDGGSGSVTSQLSITRAGDTTLTLTLGLDRSTHRLASSEITDGTAHAVITGWANVWSVAAPAQELKGYYTFALPVPIDLQDLESIPQGYGFGSFTIAPAGNLIVSGKLADGTAFTTSTFAGPSGEVLVYQVPAIASDSLVGTLRVDTGSEPVFADNMLTGGLSWSRAAQNPATQRVYAAGFGPIDMAVEGGSYVAPSASQIVMELPNVANNAALDFWSAGVGSAQSLAQPDITVSLLVGGGVTLPLAANNPRGTTLSVMPATGAISGGFTLTDPNPAIPAQNVSRPATYEGIIVRRAGGLSACGYFLLPKLPATVLETVNDTVKLSGGVVLEAAF